MTTKPSPEKVKQSVYMPCEMLSEIHRESKRLDRSVSWLLQQSWKVARNRLATYQGVEDVAEPST